MEILVKLTFDVCLAWEEFGLLLKATLSAKPAMPLMTGTDSVLMVPRVVAGTGTLIASAFWRRSSVDMLLLLANSLARRI